MLTLNGTTTNRSYVPEVCRGRNPPTILRGITHSNTHSGQKKTRNGYDNCSAKCLTLKNKSIMATRLEKNCDFMKQLAEGKLKDGVLLNAVKNISPHNAETIDSAKAYLGKKFGDNNEDWYINEIHNEYDRIATMDERNLRIWNKYRSGHAQLPIADKNDRFVESVLLNVSVSINGNVYKIAPNMDNITVGGANSAGEVVVSLVEIQKAMEISQNMNAIMALVE